MHSLHTFLIMRDLKNIDKTWTLFLDRDGVINYEKENDYILNKDEFVFYEGVLEALGILNKIFGTIVIITNQRGVAKGLMSMDDLNGIHDHMMHEIIAAGGRIDKIYACTDLDNDAPNRKPQAGMAFQAKSDFPKIDFSKTIMVGNKLSDMEFGRNAGTATVFVTTTHPETEFPNPLIDARFQNLAAFANSFQQ